MFINSFKRDSILAFVTLAIFASFGFSQTRRPNREGTAEQRKPFYEQAKRNLSDEKGRVRMELWAAGMDAVEKMQRSNWTLPGVNQQGVIPVNFIPNLPKSTPSQTAGVTWYPLGPAPLRNIYFEGTVDSGEVVGIAIDPRGESDTVMYIATGLGGIWKTTNGGGLWQPATDHMPSLSMGAVALDIANPDIVYAGTGNAYESTSNSESWGRIKALGVYRSPDGGNTWALKGRNIFGPTATRAGLAIYKILSTGPNAILVATNNGLYYSPNGGNTFGTNLPAFNNRQPVLAGDIRDLALDTTSSNIVYATVSGRGIVRSLNNGLTFPLNLFQFSSGAAKPGTPAAGTFGALWVAQSRFPNNRTLYASVINTGTSNADLYKSNDAGGTWSRLRSFGTMPGRPDYAVTIGVDPSDPARVYAGGIDLQRSTDGGSSFDVVGSSLVHPDHHAIAFSPPSHFRERRVRPAVYVGSDGGIYSSADSGDRWRVDLNQTISANLIIDFAMGKNNPRYMYAGIWDHGIASRAPGDAATSWRRGHFGDGANVAVDPLDATVCYHSSGMMDPAFIRTTDGGRTWNGVSGLAWTPDRLFFVPRMSGGRVTSTELYAARGNELHRLNTSGHRGSVTATLVTTFSGPIHRISYSETRPEAVWVATTTGDVWRTVNINASPSAWANVGSPGGTRVAAIAAHPRDADKACVVYAGFSDSRPDIYLPGRIYSTRHVYYTEDGGANWRDISSGPGGAHTNVPDLPVYDVVLIDDPRFPRLLPKIVVATEAGVMTNDGTPSAPTWRLLGWGLPKSACSRLQYASSTNVLAVSIWGRGVYRFGSTG